MLSIFNKLRSKEVKEVYYVLTFLSNLAMGLTATTYVLFLLSKGLDLFQVNVVNMVFMLSIFLFEIPTGAFADYIGRRRSILLSSFLTIACLVVYFISSSFIVFIFAEFLAALSAAFASGALDAWLVDSLKDRSDAESVDVIFSHSEIVGNIASLIGGLAGGYIGIFALNLPFGVGVIVAILGSIMAFMFVYEKPIISRVKVSIFDGFEKMAVIAKDSISFGIKHKVVLWLIISSVVTSFAFMSLNMYWSPRMDELTGNKVWVLGWIWVLISLAMIFGNYMIKVLLKQRRSYYWILIINTMVLAIPIILAATSNFFAVVLSSFLIYEIGRGIRTPIHKSFLNKHIPNEQRATVLSFDSMMGRLGGAIGLVVLGLVARNYSIQTAWLISGISLLILIPIYQKVNKYEKILGRSFLPSVEEKPASGIIT